ncbi:Predicted kinase, aminoglycoside phosphotransferase (APT) family [Sanguibacter gelidistatuariae]|uniref:Predicted kinase, aminoglycoside phosphotransferase (APT) family n=1 Tax=Sanguibacter gelidistatuariae TaxID=1814289 RepID=A0A1G6L2G2_9MICO|nr:phosphotransferase [Sanguibacter gelidistatuariae]SDC37353.1 Predicted kinase, aminoglycoside phosphotransferase (APT) family [Sanguibacter gelidistatuariae]
MSRSPLALAALSTLAVPGLDVHHVQETTAPDGFDAAIAIDAEKRRWVVRAPSTLAAGAALEAEAAFLSGLEDFVDSGRLPFEVPRAAGFAPLSDGGRAVVYPELPGHPLRVERIVPGPGISASLGRAIAALHELPVALVESSGLPVYSAEEYRQRRLSEVDEAAQTGQVPATLLRRWERSLEDVSMWRFRPTVTHTALSAETLLVRAGQISAITDFFEVQVGDPADDLSWLLVTAPQESVESILEAYQLRRTELIDPHLVDRALLASELALARWLLHGVRNDRGDVVKDAVGMLRDLDRAATEVGAFSVAVADQGQSPTGGTSKTHRGSSAGAPGSKPAPTAQPAPRATPAPAPADAAAESSDASGPQELLPDYDKVLPRPSQDVDTTAYAAVAAPSDESSDDA